MTVHNTLIFVDFPVHRPGHRRRLLQRGLRLGRRAAAGRRLLPHGSLAASSRSTTARPSPIGNLHMGIYDPANARPHPDPAGVEPRETSAGRDAPRAPGSSWTDDDNGGPDHGHRSQARRHGAVATPLLGGVQRCFNGAFVGPVGQHVRVVGRRAATARRWTTSPTSDRSAAPAVGASAAATPRIRSPHPRGRAPARPTRPCRPGTTNLPTCNSTTTAAAESVVMAAGRTEAADGESEWQEHSSTSRKNRRGP